MSDFLKFKNGINIGSLISDPVDADNGDVYYNIASNKIRSYINGVWSDIGAGASASDKVRVVARSNIPLTGSVGLTIDGVAVSTPDKILLINQSAPEENGVYDYDDDTVNYTLTRNASWTTAPDFTQGRLISVAEGDRSTDSIFCVNFNINTVGVDPIDISQKAFTPGHTPNSILPYSSNSLDIGADGNNFINLYARFLQSSSSSSSIDLYSGTLSDSSAGLSVDIEGRILYDSSGLPQIDWSASGAIDVNGSTIVNVADPTNPQDAATKAYVDASAGSGANTALSNLTTTSINQALTPDTDVTYNLGSSSLRWNNAYAQAFVSTAFTGNSIGQVVLSNTGTGGIVNLVTNNQRVKITNSYLDLDANYIRGVANIKDTSDAIVLDVDNKQIEAGGTVKLDFSGTNLDINTRKITSVVDPTSAQDAATKNYVDTSISAITGFANTTLSNLGTTAMNADLIFNKATAVLRGTDVTGSTNSEQLIVRTGNVANGTAGALTLRSGDVGTGGSGTSGAVTLRSGNHPSGNSTTTGAMTVQSGNNSGSGASGALTVQTGGVNAGGSGAISVQTGTTFGSASGDVTVRSGQTSTSGNSGAINISSGNAASSSGSINLTVGTASGTRGSINLDGNVVNVNSGIYPQVNASYPLGSGSLGFSTAYINTITYGASGPYVEMGNGRLSDASGITSLDWVTRTLKDASSNTKLDYSSNAVTISSSSNANITLSPNGTGTVDVSSKRITNVASPTSATDAANKEYVDSQIAEYIGNGRAYVDTTGWATYADAAGSAPVNGTGGSPNVTFTRSTSSPLRGVANFVFTKDAANRQGEGASYDFTIDSADQAKVLKIQFDYMIGSGTFVAGSTGTTSDVTVWIYDVTNSLIIQPSSISLFSNSSTIADRYSAYFQTASNSTSYRLIFHVGSTSASAYTLKIDNVSVSDSQYIYGTPITDWQSYTPTFTNLGTVSSQNFQYRRVGDSLEVQFRFTAASGGGSAATVTIPSGLTTSSTGNTVIGTAWTQSSSSKDVFITNATGTNTVGFIANNGAGGSLTGTDFGSGILDGHFKVKIAGWSSSVQTSDNTDTRVVVARYTASSSAAIPDSATVFDFSTKSIDTHGAVTTGASWKFTAPVYGYYKVTSIIPISGGSVASRFDTALRKNGSTYKTSFITQPGTSSTVLTGGISELVELNAGDYIDITFFETVNGGSFTNSQSIVVERVTGPSAISAIELIAASAGKTSGSQTSNNSWQTISSWTETIDTHGAFDASTGVFTAPASGTYQVNASVSFAANSTGARGLKIQKNSGDTNIGAFGATVATYVITRNASGILKLNAGDTVSIAAFQDSGGNLAYGTAGDVGPYISISRIGL